MTVHLPRTLRGRLTTSLAVLLTVALATAAVVTVLLVRQVLIDRLDSQLRAAGDRFAVGLEHDDHDADNRYGEVEGQAAGTLGARVLGRTVTAAAIVGEHNSTDRVPTQARAQLARLPAAATPQSIDLAGVGEYRIIVVAGRDGDLQITGLPTGPIESIITKLAVTVVAVFAAALLAILLVTTGLLRVMLRPLSRVSATAGEVGAMVLDTGGVSLPPRVQERAGDSELDVLARAFNAMLEQVDSALRTRADSEDKLRRFIADASHELRTPISVVRSHAELAQREGAGALPDSVSRSLERIAAQSERMGHVVEDLLLLARLDSGRPTASERIDVVRIVLDAVDDARTARPEHRWRLALPEEPVQVLADPHALAQVVSNLLANAGTHTPPATTVTVSLTTEGTQAQLTVADDGPGMPGDVAEHAFDRFVRGSGERTLTRGSSGLGLPIVAAIVTALHGQVHLSSTGAGTTVRAELPIAEPAAPTLATGV